MGKLDRVKRIWYLSPMWAAKVQASLRIRAVSPEPPLLAHTSSESRGTFRQKARSLASLNGWACAVKTCHDGMLEDTNSLDGAQLIIKHTLNCWHYQDLDFVGTSKLWYSICNSCNKLNEYFASQLKLATIFVVINCCKKMCILYFVWLPSWTHSWIALVPANV